MTEFGFIVNSDLFSDISFIVGKERVRYYGHKVILCTRSTYFRTMLTGAFLERDQKEICIPNCIPSNFLRVLEFIYTGYVQLSKVPFEELVFLQYDAEGFLLPDLVNLCEACLIAAEYASESTAAKVTSSRFSFENRFRAHLRVQTFMCRQYIRNEYIWIPALKACFFEGKVVNKSIDEFRGYESDICLGSFSISPAQFRLIEVCSKIRSELCELEARIDLDIDRIRANFLEKCDETQSSTDYWEDYLRTLWDRTRSTCLDFILSPSSHELTRLMHKHSATTIQRI